MVTGHPTLWYGWLVFYIVAPFLATKLVGWFGVVDMMPRSIIFSWYFVRIRGW